MRILEKIYLFGAAILAIVYIAKGFSFGIDLDFEFDHLEIERFKEEVWHRAERWEREAVELLKDYNEDRKDSSDDRNDRDRDRD